MRTIYGDVIETARRAAEHHLPEHMVDGFMRYVADGIPPGGFLERVLCNDLIGALEAADHINKHSLHSYGVVLCNSTPGACYGSEGAVKEWIESGGILGLDRKTREVARAMNAQSAASDVKEVTE